MKKILAYAFISAFFAFNVGNIFFPYSAIAQNGKYSAIAKTGNSWSGFSFVAAGDWGCGNAAEKTFSMMKKMKPELYLGLGDFSYAPSMDCWFDIVKEAGPLMKIVVGNHDTEESSLKDLMNKFGLDKQYYSFNYRNVHFLGLSTELKPDEYDDQFQFASDDLANATLDKKIDWIIVFQHRPLYSGSGMEIEELKEPYHQLFDKYHVDLVLAGHVHNYERSYPILYNEDNPAKPTITDHEKLQYFNPEGTIFAIVGTGGESVRTMDEEPSFLEKTFEGYGCIRI